MGGETEGGREDGEGGDSCDVGNRTWSKQCASDCHIKIL